MNNQFAQQYVYKNCLIRYPDLVTKEKRKETFVNWLPIQNPDELVKCGFFYGGREDLVVCFYCGISLGQWLTEDDPWIEHARWSPHCPYLLLNVRRSRAKYLRNKSLATKIKDKIFDPAPTSKTLCKICLDKEIEYVTLPCSHFSMCNSCVTTQNKCPICKETIRKFLHVYIP
jgi:hypothetical protein